MFKQNFLLAQVKQSLIINNKHGIYKLPQKLLKGLRFGILEN